MHKFTCRLLQKWLLISIVKLELVPNLFLELRHFREGFLLLSFKCLNLRRQLFFIHCMKIRKLYTNLEDLHLE